jgi:ZIP family zinc transporter
VTTATLSSRRSVWCRPIERRIEAVDRRSAPSEDGLTHHLFLIALGFSASLAAGLATGVGALPALFAARATNKMLDAMLGFAAGVMLAVAAFGLILPAFDTGAVGITVLGVLCGVVLFGIADRLTPHLHFISGLEGPPSHLQRVWLLVLAMTIHNLPEGLAVGVAFGREDIAAAVIIAIGIGIQNMPEGLTVALPLVREGYRPARAIAWATLTGLAEPMTALIGATLVLLIGPLLPFGLAFAAGCMLYVTLDEVIPESHSRGHHMEATTGAVLGFVLMTALERLFS